MSENDLVILKNLENLSKKIQILEMQVADLRLDKFLSNLNNGVTFYSYEDLVIQNPHLKTHNDMFVVVENNSNLFLKNANLHSSILLRRPTDVTVVNELSIECGDEKLKHLVSDNHVEIQAAETFASEILSITLPNKKYLLIHECEFKNG